MQSKLEEVIHLKSEFRDFICERNYTGKIDEQNSEYVGEVNDVLIEIQQEIFNLTERFYYPSQQEFQEDNDSFK